MRGPRFLQGDWVCLLPYGGDAMSRGRYTRGGIPEDEVGILSR